jgi:high-affinity iron transporter
VAFYACALRHLGAAEGSEVPFPAIGLATLAGATDGELDALLARSRTPPRERAQVLARLRASAPFAPAAANARIAFARRRTAEALETALRGDRTEADRLVLDAYLLGIEELEAPLRARDAALVVRLEDAVAALRAAVRESDLLTKASMSAVREQSAAVLYLLDQAERTTDASPAGTVLLALAAALLVLREGLEAALIVAAILAVVRRLDLPRSATRAAHCGWIAALLAGAATFALAGTVLSSLSLRRELLEGIVSLLAAAVLFATSFWLIARADTRRWVAYIRERASGSAARAGGAGVFAIAFLAAYREAFESALFFEALRAGEAARLVPLAAGAAAGALALVGAVAAFFRLERRLPVGPFFAASGGLLSALSVVLLGQGIHALAGSSVLVPRPISFPRVEWLGVYPDANSLAAQALLATAIATALLFIRLREPRAA